MAGFSYLTRVKGLLRIAGLSATLITVPLAHAAIGDATLVLGDQARGLRTLVEAAGVLKDVPYQYQWANFRAQRLCLRPSAPILSIPPTRGFTHIDGCRRGHRF